MAIRAWYPPANMSGGHVTLIDFGSYCDFSLTEIIVDSVLARGYTMTHVTGDTNGFAKTEKPGVKRVIYDQPESFKAALADPDIVNFMADEMTPLHEKFSHPSARPCIKLFKHITQLLSEWWEVTDAVVIHYPVLSLISIPPNFAKPIFVFYVAPGFANYSVAWPFSGRMRDSEYKLRNDVDAARNRESAISTWQIMSYGHGHVINTVYNIMKRAHIVTTWDTELLPPVEPDRSLRFVHNGGAIYDKKKLEAGVTDIESKAEPALQLFVNRHAGALVYFSLGSFATNPTEILKGLLKKEAKIVYHDLKNMTSRYHEAAQIAAANPDSVMIVEKAFDHAWIVPKCRFIVTTGSICLANIALFYGVPMLTVPLLNEQYMWAKNLYQMCKIPFVDVRPLKGLAPIRDQVVESVTAIESRRTADFFANVRAHVRNNDGCQMLVDVLDSVINPSPIDKVEHSLINTTRTDFKAMVPSLKRIVREVRRKNGLPPSSLYAMREDAPDPRLPAIYL